MQGCRQLLVHCKAAGKVAGKAAGRKLRTARLLAGSWLHRKAARQKCRTWLIAAAKIASGGEGGGGWSPPDPPNPQPKAECPRQPTHAEGRRILPKIPP